MQSSLVLAVLSGLVAVVVAHDACNGFAWNTTALNGYCTNTAQNTFSSPACSVYRLCSDTTVSPPLSSQVCTTGRIFGTLCADKPNLPECTTFFDNFHAGSAMTPAVCAAQNNFKIFNTSATITSTISQCEMMIMPGCEKCTATYCPDPLAALSEVCEFMDMGGCDTWKAFCINETPMNASIICKTPKNIPVYGSSSGSQCLADPSLPSCASYKYPDSDAQTDIGKLCTSMPDMPGCSIQSACETKEAGDAYCKPFVILATLCTDMGGMSGCENYNVLCNKSSVVQQCTQEPPITKAPTWSEARSAVFSACNDHPMAGCSTCLSGGGGCPDPLSSLASICHEMPSMGVCSAFWGWCKVVGDGMQKFCADDSAKYLPAMLMYFHQRTEELVLWKEWRPTTQGQYAGTIIAILAFGVVSTGLKTIKGALALHWTHQRSVSRQAVTSVLTPASSQQIGENLAKALIIGVSLTLDYFNMLIAMTFNIGLFCAVVMGYVLGTAIFSHVLENYAAMLHQRRSKYLATYAAAKPAGVDKDLEQQLSSSEEEYQAMAAEDECHCVHSA